MVTVRDASLSQICYGEHSEYLLHTSHVYMLFFLFPMSRKRRSSALVPSGHLLAFPDDHPINPLSFSPFPSFASHVLLLQSSPDLPQGAPTPPLPDPLVFKRSSVRTDLFLFPLLLSTCHNGSCTNPCTPCSVAGRLWTGRSSSPTTSSSSRPTRTSRSSSARQRTSLLGLSLVSVTISTMIPLPPNS
jgi:hypothetical protein